MPTMSLLMISLPGLLTVMLSHFLTFIYTKFRFSTISRQGRPQNQVPRIICILLASVSGSTKNLLYKREYLQTCAAQRSQVEAEKSSGK